MNLTQKAEIAQVPFGNLGLEGLMAEDGTFGIAMPQLVSHDLVRPNQASRDVKALMPNGYQFDQWRTTLNSKAVNVMLLTDFEKLLAKLDRAGNKAAQDMRDDLVGMSMHQLFSDAFGLKFEADDRQDFIKKRASGIVSRRKVTDAADDWATKNQIVDPYLYSTITNLVYKNLFGAEAKAIRLLLKVPSEKAPTRDYMSPKALKALDTAEESIALMIDEGTSPHQAIQIYFSAKFVRQIAL